MNGATQMRMALALLILAAVVTQAQQFGGFSGYNGYNGNGNPANGDSGSDSGSGSGSGPVYGGNPGSRPNNFGSGFDLAEATRMRAIHGIMGAIAMVALFPTGAIIMRIVRGKYGLWLHFLVQTLGLGTLVSAVALGIRLVQQMRGETGVDLMADPTLNYHFIIGIIVMVFLIFQPAFGFLHHERFKIEFRRQGWTYAHLFNGRIFITAGIANGGLGLWIAGASQHLKVAYIAAAGSMWVLWMAVVVWKEWVLWLDNKYPWKRQQASNEGSVPF